MRTRPRLLLTAGVTFTLALAAPPAARAQGSFEASYGEARQRWEQEWLRATSDVQRRLEAVARGAWTTPGGVTAFQAQVPQLPATPISSSGSVDDPKDVESPLDVKQVRHGASSTQISYEVDFYGEWQPQDLDGVAWVIDFNGDGREEACIDTFWDGTQLTGAVFGNGCSGESIQRVAVERPRATSLRAVYDIAALRKAGLKADSYRYRLESNKRVGGALAKDQVPDGGGFSVTHDTKAQGSIAPAGGGATGATTASPGRVAQPATAAPAATGTQSAPASDQAAQAGSGLPASGAPIEDYARRGLLMVFAGLVLTTAQRAATRRRAPVWEGVQVHPRPAPLPSNRSQSARAARPAPPPVVALLRTPALPAAPLLPALPPAA